MSQDFFKRFSKQPWWRVETDPATGARKVVAWNRAMVKAALDAGASSESDEAIVQEHLEWLDHKDSPKPWVLKRGDRLVRWNEAALREAAVELKIERVAKGDRGEQRALLENHESRQSKLGGVEPFMQVNHYGFAEDGAVKLEMDWNRSFINHLRDYGFEGDEDLDVVKNYLESLTSKSPQEQLQESFAEIERWAERVEDGEGLLNAFEEKLKAAKRARARK